jgi:hypothetical protein
MKRVPILIPFLALVACIFIGILVFSYVEAKKANPQMIKVEQASRLATPAIVPALSGRGRIPAGTPVWQAWRLAPPVA